MSLKEYPVMGSKNVCDSLAVYADVSVETLVLVTLLHPIFRVWVYVF